MTFSDAAYDPDTLAILYRAFDTAVHRAIPDIDALSEASQRSAREKLAGALIKAFEAGERDLELLVIIAVQSYQRHA